MELSSKKSAKDLPCGELSFSLDGSGTAAISPDSVSLCDYIRADSGLYLSEGREFGANGAAFIRMNVACPRSVLMDGLNRLAESIGHYEQETCKQNLQ